MSGAVFHPGHEELHGVTVLIEGQSGRLYVGRYHEQGPRGVVLHDVAVLEPEANMGREEWLARQNKFGVDAIHRNLVVPTSEATTVRRFSEVIK